MCLPDARNESHNAFKGVPLSGDSKSRENKDKMKLKKKIEIRSNDKPEFPQFPAFQTNDDRQDTSRFVSLHSHICIIRKNFFLAI